jgi:hypothetical protein
VHVGRDRPGDDPGQHESTDEHPGEGAVAQGDGSAEDLAQPRVRLGRNEPRRREVGEQLAGDGVQRRLGEDEERDGEKTARMDAEMLQEGLGDEARQRSLRDERPHGDRQPREEGQQQRATPDTEAAVPRNHPRARWMRNGQSPRTSEKSPASGAIAPRARGSRACWIRPITGSIHLAKLRASTSR